MNWSSAWGSLTGAGRVDDIFIGDMFLRRGG
jgi:hypothetical protein